MQGTETVSQSNRERKAGMLGEEFLEKSGYLGNYYNALMDRCDPVQQAVIHALREHVEQYERCVAKIMANGFTIQECVDIYKADAC
ncbi:MAG: hypothetical protein NC389_17995 [Acetatifactor muris]|nr:hypothetical protein [Acetatifactor muris]